MHSPFSILSDVVQVYVLRCMNTTEVYLYKRYIVTMLTIQKNVAPASQHVRSRQSVRAYVWPVKMKRSFYLLECITVSEFDAIRRDNDCRDTSSICISNSCLAYQRLTNKLFLRSKRNEILWN